MLTVADLVCPPAMRCQIDVLGDRHGLEEAFDLAVLGDVDDAVAHGRTRHAVAHRPSVEPHLAAVEEVALQHAGDDLRRLGAPRADQAEDAGDLSGEDREGRVAHDVAHREVLHAQHLLAGRPHRPVLVRAVELAGQRAADHGAHDLLAVERRRDVGHDMLAVAHDRDAVGDRERLLQRVAR